MKKVVSVSLGSSRRNHTATIEVLGQSIQLQRVGTDGDMEKAIELIRELDGKVDAFGMGGIDLYLCAGKKRYELRDARRLANAAKISPIVDGSGLKNTLERRAVYYMRDQLGISLKTKKVLMVCGVDRFGMAEAFVDAGCQMVFGDLIFALGLPLPIKQLKTLQRIAHIIAPVVSQMPFKMFYPTGEKQKQEGEPKFSRLYNEADIIAGDYLFIRKHMPQILPGKTILTNTVTSEDVEQLRDKGVSRLITTTPHLQGRSFGTNVMEGLLIALSGKGPDELTVEDYDRLLDQLDFQPWVEDLNELTLSGVSY